MTDLRNDSIVWCHEFYTNQPLPQPIDSDGKGHTAQPAGG
ncbi:hypothetical protein CBM2626_A190017 [Cupriavidus taiwanensis]|nr:hypothetical protein CBM2626_A190017 [Cupriavidus taiwanensis]